MDEPLIYGWPMPWPWSPPLTWREQIMRPRPWYLVWRRTSLGGWYRTYSETLP